MYSLFEEQITHESNELDFFLTQGTESFAEAVTYFPIWATTTWDRRLPGADPPGKAALEIPSSPASTASAPAAGSATPS